MPTTGRLPTIWRLCRLRLVASAYSHRLQRSWCWIFLAISLRSRLGAFGRHHFDGHGRELAMADAQLEWMYAGADFLGQTKAHFESLRTRFGADILEIAGRMASHRHLHLMRARDLFEFHLHQTVFNALARHRIHRVADP